MHDPSCSTRVLYDGAILGATRCYAQRRRAGAATRSPRDKLEGGLTQKKAQLELPRELALPTTAAPANTLMGPPLQSRRCRARCRQNKLVTLAAFVGLVGILLIGRGIAALA